MANRQLLQTCPFPAGSDRMHHPVIVRYQSRKPGFMLGRLHAQKHSEMQGQ